MPTAGPDEIFTAVGRALSKWEQLQGYLALIFAQMIGEDPNGSFTALRAFGTVTSQSNRLQILREAGKMFFEFHPSTHQEEFSSLLVSVEQLERRRNEIAHGVVNPYVPDAADPTSGTYALLPAYYATRKRPVEDVAMQITRPTYAHTAADVERIGDEFGSLVLLATKVAMTVHVLNRRQPVEVVQPPADASEAMVKEDGDDPLAGPA